MRITLWKEALSGIPEEQSPIIMIMDVLSNLTPEVETAEPLRSRRRRKKERALHQEIILMELMVKNKLRHHSRNNLSIKQ